VSLRPPKQFSGRASLDPIQAALDAEVMQEKASTLSRMAHRLEKALAALASWEAGHGGGSAAGHPLRDPPPQAGEGRGGASRAAPPAGLAGRKEEGRRGLGWGLGRSRSTPPPHAGEGREGEDHAKAARERERLLNEAAEALWYLIIQRELMGLSGEERVCRDYRVPQAVRARLGVRRAKT
jgi:hypothetical protein